MNNKLTTDEFVKRANIVHNNRYDYSKVKYEGSSSKVIIICHIHGEFIQKANGHLNGKGCRYCAGNNFKSNTVDFIIKSKKVHGEKYSYDKVNYITNRTPVNIICNLHGIFAQNPHEHLKGRGCSQCAGNIVLTTQDFISKSKQIHHDKYNYFYTDYKNEYVPVIISCPKHGEFIQRPNNHLNGHGCTECGIENKKLNNGFKWKTHIFPDGRMEKIQGYESRTIDYLISSSIDPNDIRIKRIEKPIILYKFLGNIRRYFPDCYLSNLHTLVETKSDWYWNKDIEQNRAKITGSLDQGYNIRFIVWNRTQLISDITYKKDI